MRTWQIEDDVLCGNIGFIVCAETQANAETNGCCCGLAPQRDTLGALALRVGPKVSVRAKADLLWSGGEEACRVR